MSAFKALYTELVELIYELESQTDTVEVDTAHGWEQGIVPDKELFGQDFEQDPSPVEYNTGKFIGKLERTQEILDKLKDIVGVD